MKVAKLYFIFDIIHRGCLDVHIIKAYVRGKSNTLHVLTHVRHVL